MYKRINDIAINAATLGGVSINSIVRFEGSRTLANVDYNELTYDISTALTIEPIIAGNYGGANHPCSYGQMLIFGGISGSFPIRLAYDYKGNVWFQTRSEHYASTGLYTFKGCNWHQLSSTELTPQKLNELMQTLNLETMTQNNVIEHMGGV